MQVRVLAIFVCLLTFFGARAGAQGPVATFTGIPGSSFGAATEIHDDIAIVGAAFENAAMGAAYIYRYAGGAWSLEERLPLPVPAPTFSLFGFSVGVTKNADGEFAVVGAVFGRDAVNPAIQSGAAWVYRKTASGWTLLHQLPQPDAKSLDFFGATVSLCGDLIVVGAPNDEAPGYANNSGTAYLYRWNGATWDLELPDPGVPGVLELTDPMFNYSAAQIGESVSAYVNATDSFVVVSTRGGPLSTPGSASGTTLVFRRNPGTAVWEREALIQCPEPSLLSPIRFGFPSAMDGEWLASVAVNHDAAPASAGAVYLSRRVNGTWQPTIQKLTCPDGMTAGSRFGEVIDIRGDLMVIGAPRRDVRRGAVYVYRLSGDTWVYVRKLEGAGIAGDFFGVCAVAPGAAIVGAPADESGPSGSGEPPGHGNGSVRLFALPNTDGVGGPVQPVDAATGGAPALLSFDGLTQAGITTLQILPAGPPPPSGFLLGGSGNYYELHSTAVFASLQVTLTWQEGEFADESTVKLWHYTGGAWELVSATPDTVNNRITGVVTSLSPFVLTEDEPFLPVGIDVKPGSATNTINLGSQGSVPVAILSAAAFDAAQIDPLSVRLANAGVRIKGNGTAQASLEDVNGDGRRDLVVHVSTQALELSAGDVEVVLTGQTYSGRKIRGRDRVRVVP